VCRLLRLLALTPSGRPGLTSWIVDKVKNWENQRNRGYQKLWAEYWRLWRGKWADEDKNRQSERSRLIAPALAQAIESAVSEIEEALFSRDVWFDVDDRTDDQARLDALLARDFLLDDFDKANVRDALSKPFSMVRSSVPALSRLMSKSSKTTDRHATHRRRS
jgi:hypothetical protein